MTKGTMITMTMSDGAEIGVYHVEPTGKRRGGLVLIQEIFGVTDHIKECCDSYAAEGYEVLGPALYDREAPGFAVSYSPEDIQKAIKIARGEHPFELSVKDALTCIDALTGKGNVFITGYCYGGTVTWAAACRSDSLAAASGYYGGQIVQMNDLKPKCPTILHFGETDHGIQDFDQAIQVNPKDFLAYNNRGLAYRNKGETDTAINSYDQAIQISPDFALAYYNRGNAYYDKRDYARTIDVLNQAIKLNQNFALAYFNRGMAYRDKRDFEIPSTRSAAEKPPCSTTYEKYIRSLRSCESGFMRSSLSSGFRWNFVVLQVGQSIAV